MKKGRCLCGKTKFEYQGDELWCGYCHCESCRRNTSSPVTVFIGVPRSAYRYTAEEPGIYESSAGVRRHFCKHCGTPMAFDADRYPDEIHFYVASLDDPQAITPSFHCHYDERLSWLSIADDLSKKKQV